MTEMHDNERIYRDLCKPLSKEDLLRVRNITLAWADALDKLNKDDTHVGVVFAACVNVIGTMGPAYCRVAAATLMQRAKAIDGISMHPFTDANGPEVH